MGEGRRKREDGRGKKKEERGKMEDGGGKREEGRWRWKVVCGIKILEIKMRFKK